MDWEKKSSADGRRSSAKLVHHPEMGGYGAGHGWELVVGDPEFLAGIFYDLADSWIMDMADAGE